MLSSNLRWGTSNKEPFYRRSRTVNNSYDPLRILFILELGSLSTQYIHGCTFWNIEGHGMTDDASSLVQ